MEKGMNRNKYTKYEDMKEGRKKERKETRKKHPHSM
jgi:hypothetical protein